MKVECTFDVSQLAAYISAHEGENIKISIDTKAGLYKASIIAKQGMATAMDTTLDPPLDGCPYPPGCN